MYVGQMGKISAMKSPGFLICKLIEVLISVIKSATQTTCHGNCLKNVLISGFVPLSMGGKQSIMSVKQMRVFGDN